MPRRDQEPDRLARGVRDRRQRLGVARFEIIEREAGSRDRGAALVEHGPDRRARDDPLGAFLEHAIERRRRGALGGREIAVAGRQREAIGSRARSGRR